MEIVSEDSWVEETSLKTTKVDIGKVNMRRVDLNACIVEEAGMEESTCWVLEIGKMEQM